MKTKNKIYWIHIKLKFKTDYLLENYNEYIINYDRKYNKILKNIVLEKGELFYDIKNMDIEQK